MYRNIFVLSLLLLAVTSCTTHHDNKDFVYIEGNTFQQNGQRFVPMMLNYVVDCRSVNDHFVIAPTYYYKSYNSEWNQDIAGINRQLSAHFRLIRDMGFNTVRICFNRTYRADDGHYYYPTGDKDYSLTTDRKEIIDGLAQLVQIAKENDLKIMLLLRQPIDNAELLHFTQEVLMTFSYEPTLFAYDLMNEPLYFDLDESQCAIPRDKEDAYRIVKSWKSLQEQYAPNQLLTIGFGGPLEVLEWDPALLPADFVQIHSYHPLYFCSEVWWYSQYIGKPWMIGETALPADNDSISYHEQKCYLQASYEFAMDCGAAGYGWWEFQENLGINSFEAQYSGLMTNDGYTLNSNSDTIVGTLKPAATIVNDLIHYQPQPAHRPLNYFNMIGYNNLVIKGKVLNKADNSPVAGAIIRGWNQNWSIGTNTYSDEKGEFTLFSNDPFVHFEISAPRMSKVKFDYEVNYTRAENGCEFSLDSLPNADLEYHQVAYHPFLRNPQDRKSADTHFYIFDFEIEKFTHYKFEGVMEDIYLEEIILPK